MKFKILVLVLFIIIFSSVGTFALDISANKYIIKGKNLFRDEKYKEAFWYYYVASSINRDEPEPWYFLGITLYKLGDFKNAHTAFLWAKTNNINENYRRITNQFIVKCKYKMFETKPHKVMKIFAKVQPNLWQAYKLMEIGEFKKSAQILTPVFKKLSLDFEISVALAVSLLHTGKMEKAFKPLKSAYKISPTSLKRTLNEFQLPGRTIVRDLEKHLTDEKQLENFFKKL